MRAAGFSRAAWNALPKTIVVRQVEYIIETPGMRTQRVIVLNHRIYRPADLSELYRRRWNIELDFRNIKVAMGMAHIACKSPAMVRKQLAFHTIAYNLIRLLMIDAVAAHNKPIERLSFKGTVDSARHFVPVIAMPGSERAARYVPHRPGRREPRATKNRHMGVSVLPGPC